MENFQQRHVKIWCLSRNTSLEVMNVLEYVNENPIIMVIPLHEMDFPDITGLKFVDSAIITSVEEPPYTTVHTLSPVRIIFVIAGTIGLFYLGVKMIGVLWAYKKEHFGHMRDPYDMLCGCARWLISLLEAAENENRGYIRSSMDSSVHDGVDRNICDSDDSDDEKSHHQSKGGRQKHELDSPYMVDNNDNDNNNNSYYYNNVQSGANMKDDGNHYVIEEGDDEEGKESHGLGLTLTSNSPTSTLPTKQLELRSKIN